MIVHMDNMSRLARLVNDRVGARIIGAMLFEHIERDDPEANETHYIVASMREDQCMTHRAMFSDSKADLISGHYDMDIVHALEDMRKRVAELGNLPAINERWENDRDGAAEKSHEQRLRRMNS